MQEYLDAVSLDVMITEIGILVAGFAAVLGIWLERDHSKPPRYAWWLSLLIILCTFVGMFQTLADAKEGAKLEGDMARMLATLDKIAQNSEVEIPELNEFVKSEVSAQARSNPDVVKKVAQRVADEGGDPAEMLGSYLPPGEVQNVARRGGLNTKTAKVAVVKAAGDDKGGDGEKAAPKGRRKLEFGGKAKVREPDAAADRKGGGDDDKERKGVRLGGSKDDDDKKGDKDDDKKGDKDEDDKERKGIKLGGKDDKDDDKSKPAGSSAPAAGKPALGGPLGGPKPGGAVGGPKPPGGGAAPPAGGLKKPGTK